ncbi:MAG: hypothetical protein Q8M07_05205 [Prosthecobacter sp.]|nr:hypothetical protein [Prosthecobacter sp.]
MMLFLKRLYEFLVQAQVSIARFFTGLPFWKDVERICLIVAGPIRGVASLALRLFPFLRRFEKYLEVESLRSRSPVILAFSITLLAFRGILTSPNGHIGTDLSVFPLLTLISSFNPFLGGLSGLVFGAADLVQKLVKPDIYGAMTWSHPNYMGALVGYIAAYSITVWMGVMPGLVSRIGRDFARKIWAKRATAHADGATPLPFDSWTGAAGLLGSMVGAMVTAFTGVRFVAPILEWPAFHWRPSPDVSCYNAELATLKATASRSAVMGVIGGAAVATTPPAGAPPPIAGIPGAPPPADTTWPPRPGTEQDGKVWFQPPWDEGGPTWMDKAEFEDMRSKQAQGLKWSGHHGWVTPEDERERDAIMARARELNRGQSEDVKKAYDAWIDSKAKLEQIQQQNLEAERLRRIEQKHAELEALEAESMKGVQTMDVVDTFMQGVEDTTRSGIADLGSADVWQEFGSSVKKDVGQLWDDVKEGVGKSETYLNAGQAVLHSATGMAEGIAMVGKAGWHAFAHPIDTTNMVLNAGGDPLAALEFVTRTADHMAGSIIDPKKRLSERLQGVAKLELEAVMGEGLGKALGAVGELKTVKNLLDKVDELKTGIFGKAAETTGQRVYGTGQTVGREVEQAAMAKLPPGHPARKIGEINEATAKAGPEFNSRLVKGDRLLDDTNTAYQKGVDALKTDPKYLTPESKKVADAVRYDQHLRAQQQAVKKMLAEHPELKGHLQGIENTGSHAWRRSDYKPGRSDIDINARGDGTSLGNKVEEAFPDYYRKAVNEVSGGRLSADDLKANCYGDGTAKGALTSGTGNDFVKSYQASGKGRLDVFDNETGQFKHSLDGGDPLLDGTRKYFDRADPAAAAQKARDFHADVAAKHFEETAELSMAEKLRQGAKNVKTVAAVTNKLTRVTLPESVSQVVKNAAALEKLPPAAQQQALKTLEDFLRKH